MPPEIGQLTQFSGVGVAGLAVYLMWKLASNELSHLTEAINRLVEVIVRLEERFKEHEHHGET